MVKIFKSFFTRFIIIFIDDSIIASISKITNLSWSPDGMEIAYDVYGIDFIGRLKIVDVTGKEVKEIINVQTLGYEVSKSELVLLLFADWVARE